MTIRELALQRAQQCGMAPQQAALMLECFARTQEGSIIGWDDSALGLSRDQKRVIDRAAVGYLNARGLWGSPNGSQTGTRSVAYDGKMRATGEDA